MSSRKSGRREFLKGAAIAGLGATALPAALQGQSHSPIAAPLGEPTDHLAYGKRSRFEKTVRVFANDSVNPDHAHFSRPLNVLTPLQDVQGIITPSSLHFVSAHGYAAPDIDPSKHTLMIHGMVDRPLVFTLDELKRMPSVSRVHYLECQANRPEYKDTEVHLTHGKTACSQWTGVLLSVLLKETGVNGGASWIVAEGAEAGMMTKSLPLKKAMEDTLIAYGQNGEAVRPENGYPLRLVAPGFEAIHSVKWLRRIKVVDRPYMGYQETGRYSPRSPEGIWFTFEQGPKSVITYPSGGQRLAQRGFHEISGLAWTGGGKVKRVEVSLDGGRTWKEAQLHDPILRMAHTRFTYAWNWNGEEAILMSRCIDELDQVQPTLAEFASFWGSTPQAFLDGTASGGGHSNAVQPWGVRSDGSIYNAIGS